MRCGAQGKLAPACGALWGIYTIKGPDLTSAVTDLEARVGREFDIVLRYHDFSNGYHQGRFPDPSQRELGTDRTLLFAWQSRVSSTDTDIAWSRISDGGLDRYIDAAADRITEYGEQVMIAFDPEFDNQDHKGRVTDYAAAYRHIHQRFADRGVTNVVWAWVSTGYLGAGNSERIMAGYPGDRYVDWIGFDPYNFYTCNGSEWQSFEQTIAGAYNFFLDQGLGHKPQILSEYGTAYSMVHPGRARNWHREIPSVLKQYPNLKALVRFNAGGVLKTGERCRLQLDNGPGMVDSFETAGRDPYVNTRR